MKKISYVFSLIMVFVLSLGVFTVGSSKEVAASIITTNSAILDKLVGDIYIGSFFGSGIKNQYGMTLTVSKNSTGKYLATLNTYNTTLNTNDISDKSWNSLRGTYNLSVSYNTSTAQYQLSGGRYSGSNSPASTVALYGKLSGGTFYGYMISNNNAASRFNFNLTREIADYICWDDFVNGIGSCDIYGYHPVEY